MTDEDLAKIAKQPNQRSNMRYNTTSDANSGDKNTIELLYFNYKTYMNEVYKVKDTATGGSKVILRDDTFDPQYKKWLVNLKK